MKEQGVYGNIEKTNLLIDEFIQGRQGSLSEEGEKFVDGMKYFIGNEWSFTDVSRQKCRDLFISMSFRGKKLTWKELSY